MAKRKWLIPPLLLPLLLSFVFISLLLWVESPKVAYAQSGSITGTVYQDVAGTAVTSTFTTFTTPVKLSLFSSTNNGTLVMTTTTDNSGHFLFTGLALGYYYITVDNTDALAGFTDALGAGMVEQTYGSSGNAHPSYSGPICAGSGNTDYAQQTDSTVSRWTINAQNKQKSGPCYGGRDAAMVNDAGTVLNLKKHIIKVRLLDGADTVRGIAFAFSSNVVTNLEDEGPGSLHMFIRAANAITGANAMRFIPAVAPNMISAANKWWRLPLTATATLLPAITGQDTTLDGLAYYYRTGAADNRNSGNIMNATVVGVSNYTITPIERPELEIRRSLNPNEATVTVSGDRVTLRRLAFSTDSNQPGSYHIRQNAGTELLVEDTIMGYDMSTNSTAATRSYYGIETAYNVATPSSGHLRHNYISTIFTSILLSNGDADPGNVVAATLGDWTIEQNILSNGIRLGAGTDKILIRHNKSDDAIIMAQSPTVNTAVGNSTITENTLTSTTGDTIRLYEADNNTITLNVLRNGSGSGVSITTGGEGNRISQNAFGNNAGNAIDLGDDGVTTATDCPGASGANGGLGRPVITNARLVGHQLTLDVTFCNSGIFDLELYKAAEGAGENLPPAGEGATYLGTLSSISGGAISGTVMTVPVEAGLAIGDKITALAIDTTTGNTSEFGANYALLLSISGKVFHDVLGAASATGPAFAGSTTADVHLYNIFGTHVGSTKLNATGEFTFDGLTNNTYYVTLNDYRSLATGDIGDGTLLVEQTYGSAGNGAAGSGPICIGPAPTYTEQTSGSASSWVAGAQNGNSAAGPCYGGRSRASSTVSGSPSPAAGASDHAIRVIVQDANVTGVAFGFSANVVTNLSTTMVQGSLPTFLKLANTLTGANTMRFVPTLPPNQTSGANSWWRIALPGALPQITDSDTALSGIAYSNVDGATIRNTNSITLGITSVVGLGNDVRANTGDEPQIQGVAAPELELVPASVLDYGLDINANHVTVAQMALYGFGDTTMPLPAAVNNYGETGNLIIRNGVDSITITHNILGAAANSFTTPAPTGPKAATLSLTAPPAML
ncbi:MAG: NosD domain-containing protein [Caldilineaceae bacterium]